MSAAGAGRFEVDVLFDEIASRKAPEPDVAVSDDSIKRRLMLCGIGLAAAFGALGIRSIDLALDTPAPSYEVARAAAAAKASRLEDTDGRVLAINVPAYGLAINGQEVWDAEEAALGLAAIFPSVDADKLRVKLSAEQRVVIDRVITDDQREAVMALGLPGLSFPPTEERVYPQGRLFSHVVGYQIPGRGGVTGLEGAATIRELQGPQATTLNVTAQTILLSELERAMDRFSAKAAWGVLMDAQDGSVAALASLPDFDPNVPGQSPASARRNRLVSDNYELGSALKALTVAAALEAGVVSLETQVDVRSPLVVGDWEIKDYSTKKAVMTVEEVLATSSNIGTGQLALALGSDRFVDILSRFGLAERLETALPEGRTPLLPPRWGEAEIVTASYGHGIAVSPLHLTAAFAATVNGGTLIKPRFFSNDPVEQTAILRPETSAAMRRGLRAVITEGTGGNAEAMGYYVIGKTATADKPVGGRYLDDGPLLSSFIGAFPGHDPRYVLLISLDEPRGTADTYGYATAGWTAAPAFRRAVERLAPVLGVMPVREDEAADGFLDGQLPAQETPVTQLIMEADRQTG
ncbi:MAG: penicillin-binding protein 2 [Pseudomonadota bacterium]